MTLFFKATRQFRSIFLDIEKVKFHVRGLNPSIHAERLEKLRRVRPNVCSNFIDTKLIAAPKKCFQQALIDSTQPLESISTETSQRIISTFMLGDTPDAPLTESDQHTE